MKSTTDGGSSGAQGGFAAKQEIVETTGFRETAAGSAVSTLSGGDEKVHDENLGARGLSTSFQSAGSGTTFMKVEVGTPSDVEQLVEKVLPAPPQDGAGRLERQFASLEAAFAKGAARALKRTAGSDNLSSAVWLHRRLRQSQQKLRSQNLVVPTKF